MENGVPRLASKGFIYVYWVGLEDYLQHISVSAETGVFAALELRLAAKTRFVPFMNGEEKGKKKPHHQHTTHPHIIITVQNQSNPIKPFHLQPSTTTESFRIRLKTLPNKSRLLSLQDKKISTKKSKLFVRIDRKTPFIFIHILLLEEDEEFNTNANQEDDVYYEKNNDRFVFAIIRCFCVLDC